MRSTGFGIILILFILLVIATTFVYSPSQRYNQPDNGLTAIQGSIGFNIYNHTSSFTLESTSLEGDFESPFPPSHFILPYRSYHFELQRTPFIEHSAYVTYNVLLMTETVGSIRIRMSEYGPLQARPATEVQSINGPIRYDNGGTYVNIRNA
ncbi:hypothetical protein SAMN05444162_4971 [Paenibacillaceae bacterium GAS479]|nr:hypothetical protein SAMN05444162_4971 [Paenibacillaceae bacterium GAS479]